MMNQDWFIYQAKKLGYASDTKTSPRYITKRSVEVNYQAGGTYTIQINKTCLNHLCQPDLVLKEELLLMGRKQIKQETRS